MDQLIRRAAETILNLGIAPQETIQPYLDTWLDREPDAGTHDEDSELARFLSDLYRDKVISRSQGRTLLAMLTERAPPPPGDPYVGRRFGSFIAEEKVGEGAMGKVYRATREGTLERNFVIKIFTSSSDDTGVRRFRREGEVMASLDHPNIVKVVGAGEESGVFFLALEFFEGPTLGEMIKQRGRFSWKSATRAIKQIASALAAAHEKGVIHRDVKPQNVLVAPGGMLKVFDFGLAKTLDSKSSGLSQAGEILGSPAYMAPEQWGDHAVDERADLFAVGVIYYLLMAGETPFKGRTPADYSYQIREGTFTPIDKAVPGVPSTVSQILTQLLEKDRNYRTPSAARLVSDLDRVLRGKGPNVSRLEDTTRDPGVDRFPLVGAESFSVGVDFEADVFIDASGVLEDHATIERTEGGLVLTAKGSTLVNGKVVKEIALRDKDLLVFGEGPTLRYRIGNIGRRDSSRHYKASERLSPLVEENTENPGPPIVVPGLPCGALQDGAHKLVLVSCFEALDSSTRDIEIEATRGRLLRAGFPLEVVNDLQERAYRHCEDRVWLVADRLFTTTRENLGRSVEAWLAWWFEVRHRYPRQLRPPGTRAGGELSVVPAPEAESFTVDLSEKEDWIVGRGDDCDIPVHERSVSRQHVRLHRLATRVAYVDLGSRFGTTIDGERVSVGILQDGQSLKLGRAVLTYSDTARNNPGEKTDSGGTLVEVDYCSFRALTEMRSPAVALTLIRLLDKPSLSSYCTQTVAAYETGEKVNTAIDEFLGGLRELAVEALPAITQANLGDQAAAWTAWWNANQAKLGQQVEPQGWGSGG